MSFAVQTSSSQLARRRSSNGYEVARIAAIGSLVTIYVCLVGIVPLMVPRYVIFQILSFGHLLVVAPVLLTGYFAARALPGTSGKVLAGGAAGLAVGISLLAMLLLITQYDVRDVIITAGPQLIQALLSGRPIADATWMLPSVGLVIGAAGGFAASLDVRVLRLMVASCATVLMLAILKDVVISILANFPNARPIASTLYGTTGLRAIPAMVGFGLSAATIFVAGRLSRGRAPSHVKGSAAARWLLIGVVALILPAITNAFVGQVMLMVCLYVLMSAGLNIELGYAGLVDLGFVAFFAIGAYVVALLGSGGSMAVASWSFWVCLPLAVVAAAMGGLVFGLPVLRVRGDYLAMATLGLGEIVRVLVLSDALKPMLGASMGIADVLSPVIMGVTLKTPTQLYYLGLALLAVVVVISVRLKSSKVGRAWLALRQDEDVAQALGIDPVLYKLIAYVTGAAFAGAAGAVFAVLIGGVYPHSFQLLVSVNVLAILIIGGLGSIPGVVCGALVLVGLPELLREFGEYRYLVYGLLLVAMMHFKPAGLWPATTKGAGK